MAIDDLDPAALASPLRAGLQLVRFLQRWSEGPERGSMYRDHYEEWVGDLAQALREHAGDVEALAERLDALEQDRERVLVLGNFGLAAWREAVDRRRAMFADAAEAAVTSDLTAAELGRVERTIRMLDPEDLDLLVRLQQGPTEGDPRVTYVDSRALVGWEAQWRHEELARGHLEGAALVASGCVQLVPPPTLEAAFGAYVTAIGRLVLRFLGRSP